MKKSFKEFLYGITPQSVVNLRNRVRATTYPLVKNPERVFQIVATVKEDTWEKTYYPEMYGHNREQCLEVFSPAQYLMMTSNAVVSTDSDVVITDHGVYWDKFNDDEFVTWAIPADKNVMWYDHEKIGIHRYKKQETIEGLTLSMVGVWSFHWGHCLISFISKLFSAGEVGLLNQPMTLLVTEDEDKTILQILDNYLKDYPKITLRFAKKQIDYICETLLFMPATAPNFNGPKFRLDYPYIVPRYVIDNMNKYVVKPFVDKVKDEKPKYDKIFLPRPGSMRTLTNYDEVHDYFKSLGFVDLEGSKLDILEKASLFYHAKEIVALYGSSLQNTMFCNGAKCMVLINYRMATDTSLYIPQREHLSCWINVAGQDESDDYHSNYYIPLEKIKEVYHNLIESRN